MSKKLIIIGVAVLLVCVGLSGCFESNNGDYISSEENRFVGTWIASEESSEKLLGTTITFYSDRNVHLEWSDEAVLGGTYEIKDEKLTINLVDGEVIKLYNYSFSNNNQYLTISSIDNTKITLYIKQ